MIDPNTKLTKAMIDAMTLAEFEQLSPDEKVLVWMAIRIDGCSFVDVPMIDGQMVNQSSSDHWSAQHG